MIFFLILSDNHNSFYNNQVIKQLSDKTISDKTITSSFALTFFRHCL